MNYEVISKMDYAHIGDSNARIIVKSASGKYGLINGRKKAVIKARFDEIRKVQDNLFICKKINGGRLSEYLRTYEYLYTSDGINLTPKGFRKIETISGFINLFIGYKDTLSKVLIDKKGHERGSLCEPSYKIFGDFIFIKFQDASRRNNRSYKMFDRDGYGVFGEYINDYNVLEEKGIVIEFQPGTCVFFDLISKTVKEDVTFNGYYVDIKNPNFAEVVINYKHGLIDSSGNFVFECKYADILFPPKRFFSDKTINNVVLIKDYDTCLIAFANLQGEILTEFKYSNPSVIENLPLKLLFTATRKDYYSFCILNKYGEELIKAETALECKYMDIQELELSTSFDFGLFIHVRETGYDLHQKQVYITEERRKGKWGYIDSDGRLRLEFKYDKIEKFSKSSVKVTINDKVGLFDVNSGKMIVKPIYDEIELERLDGSKYIISATINGDIETLKIPVCNEEKEEVSLPKSKIHDYFKYTKCGKMCIEDRKGKVVFSDIDDVVDIYKDKFNIENDIFILQKGHKYGFVSYNGNVLYPFELDDAREFVNGYSVVTKAAKKGIIDCQGRLVVKFELSNIKLE